MAAENIEKSDLQALIDVDSPVFEAASLTDKVTYVVAGQEYTSYNAARKAGPIDEIGHEVKPLSHAIQILNNRLKVIQRRFHNPVRVLVSNGDSNYRYGVSRDYKGNRPPGTPWWIKDLREWLVDAWNAEVSPQYMETDDVLAEAQTEHTCIVSKDKDLNTVAGWHFNYSKPANGIYYVSEFDAWKFFCVQMLAGDGADNIRGLPACPPGIIARYKLSNQARRGCGMASAEKILSDAETESELIHRVLECYTEYYGGSKEAFIEASRAAQLLRMGWRYVEPKEAHD